MLQNLYARYGALMVQFEILQSQINETKRQIIEELNKQKPAVKNIEE